MANQLTNINEVGAVIAKAAAKMFADKTVFCKSIDKEDVKVFEGMNGYKSGQTIKINKPARFDVTNTADITGAIQDVTEETTELTLDTRSVVGIQLDSQEIFSELGLKSWMKRILEPAVSRIAQDVEQKFQTKAAQATSNLVGTAGSTVFDTELALQANQKITEFLCPDMDNRFFLLNPAANTSAVNARKGLFQSSEEIAQQYKRGYMGTADGLNYLTNNLVYVHTNGNDVTGVNVDGASQTGATLNVQGLTVSTGTVTKGSVFTIAGVNAVHPITKTDLGYLQQFTVTADATADGSGDAALAISPAIITSGTTQTVTAGPADTAALTFVGAADSQHAQNLAFHKSAFRMVSVPLVKPEGMDMVAQETVDGITIRIVRGFDIKTDQMVTRLDFLGGLAAVRPEWSCRATS